MRPTSFDIRNFHGLIITTFSIMGKCYYCDYCKKGFPDNRVSREKHLKSFAHQLAYKQHYASCTDPLELVKSMPENVRKNFISLDNFLKR